MTRAHGRGRAGLTLIEVLVSATILAGLALALMTIMVPMGTASSEQAALLDMDRVAAKVLGELRRELRVSGRDGGAVKFGYCPTFTPFSVLANEADLVNPQDNMWFQMREGPDSASDWGPKVAGAASQVIYRHVAVAAGQDAPGRIERTMPGTTPAAGVFVALASQVAGLTFEVEAGDQVVAVSLALQRTTNRGAVLRRTYTDRIEMMNR